MFNVQVPIVVFTRSLRLSLHADLVHSNEQSGQRRLFVGKRSLDFFSPRKSFGGARMHTIHKIRTLLGI